MLELKTTAAPVASNNWKSLSDSIVKLVAVPLLSLLDNVMAPEALPFTYAVNIPAAALYA